MLKLNIVRSTIFPRLITVQDNTMLKRKTYWICQCDCLITVQDNTMLKQAGSLCTPSSCLITVQDNTMLKPRGGRGRGSD